MTHFDRLVVIVALVFSHALAASADGSATPSFRNQVQPILYKMGCNTGACHGAAAGKNGFKLSLRGYDNEWDHNMLTRQAAGRRVNLADPAGSLMLLKPTMQIPHEGGERFTVDSEPYKILKAWIDAGALGDNPDDPVLTRIEISPKSATLKPDATSQLAVTAHYSDGSEADVTRWCKFNTTNDTVAMVDDFGKVSVLSPGAASITVWYSSKVAFADVTAPRPNPVADTVYATAESHGYIDELVITKLKELQIAPAKRCSDSEFIRRTYLDALGILPTPEETFRFVMDASEDKRADLIDAILARPEYVDYWTYKWCDLLLVSSRNLPDEKERNAFYDYIRRGVEENKPWDAFAREIVTASGNTLKNGAANFYVMHKEKTELTETTTQAFLSMSIQCAKCHNHPLEKWTQDDYFGMTNLFARVKLKDGVNGGTDVIPASFGDVIHPRIGRPMPPKPLDGESIAVDAPGDRREQLATWLTSPENPYFTRAITNRVWKNFMGRGLCDPEDDLRLTNPATNEKLLDAMAADVAEHAYDLKYLMRTIMNSAAYQRSSEPADPNMPDDRFYSHYIARRLPAEVILDTYAQVTGVPTEFAGYAKGTRALQLKDSKVASYFLQAFGRPDRNQTCSCERTEDASVAQTLHLSNGETLNDKIRSDECRVNAYLKESADRGRTVDELFVSALSRYPKADERARALDYMAQADDPRQAAEDLLWAVLSGKEFLFNH